MTPSQHTRRLFAATQWSMVTRLDAPHRGDAGDALARLCLGYWYPVYGYLRRCGHSPAIANDITRSFLQHLLEQFRGGGPQRIDGKFRHYLLERLHDFLAGDWASMIGRETAPELAQAPADLESRHERDSEGVRTPEEAYQRAFALELLARALARLRREAVETGRSEMYEALEPYVGRDPPAGEYEEIARRLHTKPLALVVAVKRLRQRFREIMDAELADTVTSAEELVEEQKALFAVLAEGS